MNIKPHIQERLQQSFHNQMTELGKIGWTIQFDETDPLFVRGKDTTGERFECRAKYEITHGSDGSTFYTVLTSMKSMDRIQPGEELYSPLFVITESKGGSLSFF